jgi:hypothetical protein
MEFLTDDVVRSAEASDPALKEYFGKNAARYAKPGRVTFRQVYFSNSKRGETTAPDAAAALAALAKGASDEAFGDPFLHGYVFTERETDEVTAAFGSEFAAALAAQAPGAWHGPLVSSYGLHLVRVEARQEPRQVKLEEVSDLVLRDFNEERRRTANAEIFQRLREQYQVTVDEAALLSAGTVHLAQR